MKKKISSLLPLLIASSLQAEAASYKLIHAGQLLTDAREDVKQEHSILIKDQAIIALKPGYMSSDDVRSNYDDVDSLHMIDMTDAFVMAGMIDSHTHIADELSKNEMNLIIESFKVF